jgi:Domain of unknown function (DUF4326)
MIKIIGPRDKPDASAINTTSRSADDWSSGLSPFKLGPVSLYDSHTAQIFENAWQFAKLYPEHADSQGEPTTAYWNWAKHGWNSQRPYRYPLGKGRRPLCSLWNGQRLDYIAARKQIYLPLYQNAVAQTSAYRQLEQIYHRNQSITLFDFDGYDHTSLDMTLADVLNCATRICGHAFILAMMLTYGADFTLSDLETSSPTSDPPQLMHPITVVNIRTFQGPAEYIGRPMPGHIGSPLGNPYKIKPWGPYDRDESVRVHYRSWLWKEMQKRSGEVYRELIRLALIAIARPLKLACWCAPKTCHGEIIKNAITYLIQKGYAA